MQTNACGKLCAFFTLNECLWKKPRFFVKETGFLIYFGRLFFFIHKKTSKKQTFREMKNRGLSTRKTRCFKGCSVFHDEKDEKFSTFHIKLSTSLHIFSWTTPVFPHLRWKRGIFAFMRIFINLFFRQGFPRNFLFRRNVIFTVCPKRENVFHTFHIGNGVGIGGIWSLREAKWRFVGLSYATESDLNIQKRVF